MVSKKENPKFKNHSQLPPLFSGVYFVLLAAKNVFTSAYYVVVKYTAKYVEVVLSSLKNFSATTTQA